MSTVSDEAPMHAAMMRWLDVWWFIVACNQSCFLRWHTVSTSQSSHDGEDIKAINQLCSGNIHRSNASDSGSGLELHQTVVVLTTDTLRLS